MTDTIKNLSRVAFERAYRQNCSYSMLKAETFWQTLVAEASRPEPVVLWVAIDETGRVRKTSDIWFSIVEFEGKPPKYVRVVKLVEETEAGK